VSASVLKTSANRKSPEFEKNSRRIVDLLTTIKTKKNKSARAAAPKPSTRSTKKGRLTARERIAKLIDPGSRFLN